jgi:hypothetical protein
MGNAKNTLQDCAGVRAGRAGRPNPRPHSLSFASAARRLCMVRLVVSSVKEESDRPLWKFDRRPILGPGRDALESMSDGIR